MPRASKNFKHAQEFAHTTHKRGAHARSGSEPPLPRAVHAVTLNDLSLLSRTARISLVAAMLPGWSLDTDVERDWLFVRASRIPGQGSDDTLFADAVMAIANQRNNLRLIVDLGQVMLTSLVAGQLVILHKRVHLKGGGLRLCGMSDFNRDVLRLMGVLDRFHLYSDRAAAGRG